MNSSYTHSLILSIVTLIVVLALLYITFICIKKITTKLNINYKSNSKLSISDRIALDEKREIVVVKKDNVEYIIILSPQSETVIDNNKPKL